MAKSTVNKDFLSEFDAQFNNPNTNVDFLADFDAQLAKNAIPQDKGFLSNVGSLIGRGSESALAAAEVSPAILAGTAPEKKAGIIAKELSTPQVVAPKELKEVQTAFLDEAAAMDKAKHWYSKEGLIAGADFLGELGTQMLTNPKGMAYLTSQSAANMAPSIVGMLIGGKTGAAVGTAVLPGVGTAVGGISGSLIGGFTGQVPMETGSEFIGLVGKELSARGMEPTEANVTALLKDKKFVDKAISDARTKGVTTATVDSAMTLLGGRIASGPRRAAVEAARKELGAGADATKLAERAAEIIKETPRLQKISAGAKGVALDVAGGGASEAAGQQLAYGKVDLSDVGQEMLGELGGAGIEVPAAAYSATRDLISKPGQPPTIVPPVVTPGNLPPPVAPQSATPPVVNPVLSDEDVETVDEEAPAAAPVAKAGQPVNVTWTPDGQTEPQTAAGTLTTWKDGSQFVRVQTGVLENGKPTFTNVPVAAQGVQVTPIEAPKAAVQPTPSETPVSDVSPPVVKMPTTTNPEEQKAALDKLQSLPIGGIMEVSGGRYRKTETGWDIVKDEAAPVAAEVPVQAALTAPAETVKPDDGMVRSGEQLKTINGRIVTVPPIKLEGNRQTTNTLKRLNEWAYGEAIKETAGNSYQQTLLKAINPKKMSQSDQDTVTSLLFGDVQVGPNNRITAPEPLEAASEAPAKKKPAFTKAPSDPALEIESIELADRAEAAGQKTFADAIRSKVNNLGGINKPADLDFWKSKVNDFESQKGITETPKQTLSLENFVEGYDRDTKRYEQYKDSPEIAKSNEYIQLLTDKINELGFKVEDVNPTSPPEVQKLKEKISQIAGSTTSFMKKNEAIDKEYKRADPARKESIGSQLAKDFAEVDALLGIAPEEDNLTPAEDWNLTVKNLSSVSNFPNVTFEELTPELQEKIVATKNKDGKLGGKNIMQFGPAIEKQLKIKANLARQAEQKAKAEEGKGAEAEFMKRVEASKEELRSWLPDFGWATEGGRIIRDPETGEVIGRTTWEAKNQYLDSVRSSLGRSFNVIKDSVEKAIAGEKLNAKQMNDVNAVIDLFDELKAEFSTELTEDEINAELDIASQEQREDYIESKVYTPETEEAPVRGGAKTEELELTGQTEAEIKADEAKAKAEAEAKAKAESQAEQRRKAEKETFTLTGSDREADKAAAAGAQGLFDKTELEADFERIKKNTVTFASGLTSINDLESGARAKRGNELSGIGIDIGELSANGLNKLAEAILGGTRVFVDSGAFSTFRSNVKNNEDKSLNFDSIIEKYDAITKAVEELNIHDDDYPSPMIVMPDVVGNQKASIDLVEKYKNYIRGEADFNSTIPIVPIQKGELTLAEVYKKITGILGTSDFTVGLPSNAEAISQNELRDFLREIKPANVHFLGAAADKTLTPLLQIVAKESPKTKVTADASQIRSKILSNVKMGMGRKEAINLALNDFSDPQWNEEFKNYGIKESDFNKVKDRIAANLKSGMDKFKAFNSAIDEFAQKTEPKETKQEAPKAKTEAEIEAEEEAAYEALQAQAEAEVDAGPIGQAIQRIEDGDFENKGQVRGFVNRLEKNGVLDDVEEAREGLSDREQSAGDVLDTLRGLLDDARDNAVQERMDELESEQDNEITKEEVNNSTDMSKAVHAAIESELTSGEINRINKNYGTTDTDVAVDKFTEDFTDWVFAGAKDVKHALSDLFNKIWLSIKHGMLSIAMLVNINPANIPVQTVNLPVTTYTVKQTVERPKVDFKEAAVPGYIQQVADNRMRAHPNKPIIIVDKQMGLTYVIDTNGVLAGKSASLTGKTKGDFRSEEAKKIASVEAISEKDKVTEAGMFDASIKNVPHYGNVITLQVFNNYSIAMHQTYLGAPAEQRQARLESATPEDNRISFGCINVSNEFMQDVVFKAIPKGLKNFPVVVIPESKSIQAFWPSEDFASSETKYVTKTEQTVPVSAPEKKVDTSAIKQDDFESEGFLYNIESKPQTETPAFKKWFGDSKVVGEDGKPLVVYHGTKRSFDTFAPYAEKATRGGQALYDVGAMFFSADKELATAYSGVIKGMKGYFAWPTESAYGGNVMPVYLSLKNPLVINAENQIYHKVEESIRKAKRDGYDGVIINNLVDTPGTAGALDAFVHTAYVAFKPNQIKSAIGNKGTFDKTGDILQNQQQFVKDGIAYESEEDYRDRQIQELRVASMQVGKAVKQIASYGSNLPLQRKLNKLLEREAAIKEYLESTKPDNNSAADFMARATKELAAENINDEVEAVIRQVYEKYPGVLEGLKLSLKQDKSNRGTKLGLFNPYERLVTLYKGTSGAYNAETVRHELMHSLEQMMTPQAKMAVVNEWARALEKAMKKHTDPASKAYFDAVLKFLESPSKENFDAASKRMPSYDFYQYINPSEYWAVNAEKLFASKLGTPWNRFVLAVKRLIEGLKNVIGFDNNYQVHKVFNSLLKTTPERMSKQMLIDYVTKGKVKLDFLQNVNDERKLMDGLNVPEVPSHIPKTLREKIGEVHKSTEELVSDIRRGPNNVLKAAGAAVGDNITEARIQTINFNAGLERADAKRYAGKIRDANNNMLPSIAVKNATHANSVYNAVLHQGKMKYDENLGSFTAYDSDDSMKNIIQLQHAIRTKAGVDLGDKIINSWFAAKRTKGIQSNYLNLMGEISILEEELLTEEDPELVEELSSELNSLKKFLDALEAAFINVPSFLVRIDPKKPTKVVDGKTIPNILYDRDGMPVLNDDAIDEIIALENKYPELKEMMKNWRGVNHNMIDNMAFSSRISKKEAEGLKKIEDYSPWQRIRDDEEQGLFGNKDSSSTSGIARFKKTRTELPLENVVENMTNQVKKMVSSSIISFANNRIAMEYAVRKDPAIDKKTGLPKVDKKTGLPVKGKIKVFSKEGRDSEGVRFPIYVNGKRIVIQIADEQIADALLGLAMGPVNVPFQAALSGFSNLVRRSITFSGYFQTKQVFYDAPTAAWVSGVKSPFKVWKKSFSTYLGALGSIFTGVDRPTIRILKAAGVGGYHTFHRESLAEEQTTIEAISGKGFARFKRLVDKIGDASDYAQRGAIYDQVLAETGDPSLALLKASDVVDWNKRGLHEAAQGLRQTVPFLGAYAIQLDALSQAAIAGGTISSANPGKEISRRQALMQFYLKTGLGMAGLVFFYSLAAGSDDDYWKLDDDTRARNFYLPFSKRAFGYPILIPMHSTAALFWKVIPEATTSYVISQGTKNEIDASRARSALWRATKDSVLGPMPIPAAIKTPVEIAINYNFFTGTNVVPQSLVKLNASEQYNYNTSELGKALSAATTVPFTGNKDMQGNRQGEKRLLNPIEADHLIRGWLGSVGSISSWVSNQLFGEYRPASEFRDNPLAGGIIGPETSRRNEALFYDLKEKTEPAYNTYIKLVKENKKDEIRNFYDANRNLIEAYGFTAKADSKLQDINTYIKFVGKIEDKAWTKDKKLAEILRMQALKSEVLEGTMYFRKRAGL